MPTKSCRIFRQPFRHSLDGAAFPSRIEDIAVDQPLIDAKNVGVSGMSAGSVGFRSKTSQVSVSAYGLPLAHRVVRHHVQVRDRSICVQTANVPSDGCPVNATADLASPDFFKAVILTLERASSHPCSSSRGCRHLTPRLVCASRVSRECGRRWRRSSYCAVVDRGMVDAP